MLYDTYMYDSWGLYTSQRTSLGGHIAAEGTFDTFHPAE